MMATEEDACLRQYHSYYSTGDCNGVVIQIAGDLENGALHQKVCTSTTLPIHGKDGLIYFCGSSYSLGHPTSSGISLVSSPSLRIPPSFGNRNKTSVSRDSIRALALITVRSSHTPKPCPCPGPKQARQQEAHVISSHTPKPCPCPKQARQQEAHVISELSIASDDGTKLVNITVGSLTLIMKLQNPDKALSSTVTCDNAQYHKGSRHSTEHKTLKTGIIPIRKQPKQSIVQERSAIASKVRDGSTGNKPYKGAGRLHKGIYMHDKTKILEEQERGTGPIGTTSTGQSLPAGQQKDDKSLSTGQEGDGAKSSSTEREKIAADSRLSLSVGQERVSSSSGQEKVATKTIQLLSVGQETTQLSHQGSTESKAFEGAGRFKNTRQEMVTADSVRLSSTGQEREATVIKGLSSPRWDSSNATRPSPIGNESQTIVEVQQPLVQKNHLLEEPRQEKVCSDRSSERVSTKSFQIQNPPPTICLDCRPEPHLLGEKDSSLRNLKRQVRKHTSPSSNIRAGFHMTVVEEQPAIAKLPSTESVNTEESIVVGNPSFSVHQVFEPIREASSALHAGDYTAMLHHLEGHSSLELSPREQVAVIFGKGVALFKRGKLKEAAKQFTHCEEEAIRARFPGDAAICHVYLGDINFAKQSYQQASKHYNRAVELYNQKCVALEWYRMSIPTISAIQAKCGSSYRNAHQVASAVETYKKAIANAKSSKDSLSAHTSLGNLYQSLGENKAALAEYEESIRLATELRDYVSLGWAHGNMGNAYLGLFQKDKALHHLEKSLKLALEHEPTPQAIGRAYNNIGTAHQAMNNLDKAEEYYNDALNQAVYGRDTAGQARACGNLGNVLMIQKKYDKAIPHYTEVLSLSKDRSTISTAYHNRGCAYYEWAESMKKQQLQKIKSQIDSGSHTSSSVSKDESQLNPTEKYNPTGASVKKSSTPLACTEESANSDLLSTSKTAVYYYGPDASDCEECNRPPVIPDSILKLYEKGCKDLKQVVKFHEETLESIKGSTKGLSLSVSLFETNARTFHRLQDCLVNLNHWQEALLVAEQSRARALGELLLNKKVVQQPPSSPLTLDQILDSIVKQQSCPVVHLSYTGARLLGWVLVPKREKVAVNMFHVPLEDNQFDGKPFDYHLRYSLSELLVERSFEMYTPFDYKSETNKPVANLYDIIGEPMCNLLKKIHKGRDKVQKVAIIPDSYTNLLPFTCLLETGGTVMHYGFLGDGYSFQIMPSLLSMSIMDQLLPTEVCIPADSRNICVVGNPSIPPFVYNGEQWSLGRLPYATKEAEWVAHILSATPILQEQATKSAVLMRIINSKVIHLATHGSATAGFLAFATMTPSLSWEAVDSKSVLVYPEEIEKQNISPALVVLSSCDSGRGQVKADGILGMARAFILAGAQSVLTTLWRVPDESACMFMQFFYQYLVDGLRGSEALQKSSLSLRCFKKYSQYIHWSGFQLTGKEVRFDITKPALLKALDARLGTCTIFPRLKVVKQLESALITNPHSPTDVQILRGNSGVKPSEPLLNFIRSFYEHFKGGIFWINCRNQALVDASVEYIETTINTTFPKIPVSESQQVLVVFDNIEYLPNLPEGSESILKNHSTHIVVVSKHSLPPDQLVREVDHQLLRGSSIIDIEPLSAVHSTQRVVHSVLSEHHLAPKNEEQEVFERLAEFMCGSPVIIDLVSALLLHKMSRTEKQPSEILIQFSEDISLDEIEYTPSQTAAVLSERPLLHPFIARVREISEEIRPEIEHTMPQSSIYSPYSTSAPDSWVVITRLIDQCSLSPEEQMLLNCLSLFGCTPVPTTVVSELSLLICHAFQRQHLSGSLHSKLLQLRLLQRYPTPLICHPTLDSRKPPGSDPEFVYVPQYISYALYKDCMTPEDKFMAIGSAYKVLSTFPKSIQNKPNFVCGIAIILRQFCDTNYELVGKECYQLVCNLSLQHLPHEASMEQHTE